MLSPGNEYEDLGICLSTFGSGLLSSCVTGEQKFLKELLESRWGCLARKSSSAFCSPRKSSTDRAGVGNGNHGVILAHVSLKVVPSWSQNR